VPAVSSRRNTGRRRFVTDINVVPYIDVMLVLLVIFMVTAPLIPTGVIELPRAGQSASQPEAYIEILVHADGELRLATRNLPRNEERSTTRPQLAATLRDLHKANPMMPVVISGDRQVRYEAIIDVMDELQRQNVRRVALMVQPSR
jgi:biopolymer transport protein TolR